MSLQEANYKGHRANKVLFLGNLKKLLSTGTSRWNNRQMALWDQVSHQSSPTSAPLCTPPPPPPAPLSRVLAPSVHSRIHSLTKLIDDNREVPAA